MAEDPEKLAGGILKSLPGYFNQVALARVCAAYVLIENGAPFRGLKKLERGPYKMTATMLMQAWYVVDEGLDQVLGAANHAKEILDKVREHYNIQPPTA